MKKIRLNQRGIAHLAVLVLIVVAVGAIGFVGYTVSTKNKNNSSSKSSQVAQVSQPAVKVDDTCLKQLNDKDLCKFATNVKALDKTSFVENLSMSNESGSTTMKISQDANGNNEASFKMAGFDFDVITVGGYIYSKDSGVWVRYPAGSDLAPPAEDPLKDMNLFDAKDYTDGGKVTFKKVGTEACGSVTCFKYDVTDRSDTGGQYSMWFDTKDYQLRRMYFKSGAETFDLSISYENVKVAAPATWKDYKTQ